MITLREFSLASSDGIHSLHCMEWAPEGTPLAVVQLVHGLSDYIARYDELARSLAERGFLVCGHDHLGHGLTAQPGEYGFLGEKNGWDFLARDVRALRVRMGEDHPGLPYFLLGHSMGSFVVRTCLIRWPGTLTGAVLSGTGQESRFNVFACKLLCRLFSALHGPNSHSPLVETLSLEGYNRQFAPNRTPNDWICRDEARVDAYTADPLCQFTPTVGMFRDMMGGLQLIRNSRALSKMDPRTPVYLYSGAEDPVGGSGKGVERVAGFFRDAGVQDVTVKLYPGGRHEMHNELNREEVFADLARWLLDHLPPEGQI